MAPSGKPKRLPNFKLLHEREQARVERFKVRRRAARHFMLGSGGPQLGSGAWLATRSARPHTMAVKRMSEAAGWSIRWIAGCIGSNRAGGRARRRVVMQ